MVHALQRAARICGMEARRHPPRARRIPQRGGSEPSRAAGNLPSDGDYSSGRLPQCLRASGRPPRRGRPHRRNRRTRANLQRIFVGRSRPVGHTPLSQDALRPLARGLAGVAAAVCAAVHPPHLRPAASHQFHGQRRIPDYPLVDAPRREGLALGHRRLHHRRLHSHARRRERRPPRLRPPEHSRRARARDERGAGGVGCRQIHRVQKTRPHRPLAPPLPLHRRRRRQRHPPPADREPAQRHHLDSGQPALPPQNLSRLIRALRQAISRRARRPLPLS